MVLQGLLVGHSEGGRPMSQTAQSRFMLLVFQCIWLPK